MIMEVIMMIEGCLMKETDSPWHCGDSGSIAGA
jgi:hypothetical protein